MYESNVFIAMRKFARPSSTLCYYLVAIVMGQASNVLKCAVVSLETLLQQMRLPFVKIENHLAK
jgi:hypothetical protein